MQVFEKAEIDRCMASEGMIDVKRKGKENMTDDTK